MTHASDEERRERLLAMKTGPRAYTAEQAAFMQRAVADRQPLPAEPLPVNDPRG